MLKFYTFGQTIINSDVLPPNNATLSMGHALTSFCPTATTAKYLGMNLDGKLRCCEHVKKKVDKCNIRLLKMYWLDKNNSELATHKKILLLQTYPTTSSNLDLRISQKKNNHIHKIQTFQNKVLGYIVNILKYNKQATHLNRDLGVAMVADIIEKYKNSYEN